MGIVLVAFLAAMAPGPRDEHVNFETDQFIGQGGKPVELIFSVSILDKRRSCPQHSRDHGAHAGLPRARCLKRDGLRASQS